MKTNNRPKIKVTQYEHICENENCKKIYWEKIETCFACVCKMSYSRSTGKIRIVEEDMSDGQWNEILLKENKEQKETIDKLLYLDKYSRDIKKECLEYQQENQELKEHNINQRKAFAILLNEEEDKYKKEFRELNDKLLKVVESVIKEHHIYGTYRDDYGNSIIMCNCENEFSRKDYKEHLLQEIKSAMEKVKHV